MIHPHMYTRHNYSASNLFVVALLSNTNSNVTHLHSNDYAAAAICLHLFLLKRESFLKFDGTVRSSCSEASSV